MMAPRSTGMGIYIILFTIYLHQHPDIVVFNELSKVCPHVYVY